MNGASKSYIVRCSHQLHYKANKTSTNWCHATTEVGPTTHTNNTHTLHKAKHKHHTHPNKVNEVY
jgi:hypothetical protein